MSISRASQIALNVIVILVIVSYFALAYWYYQTRSTAVRCQTLSVVICDSAECAYITPQKVARWIAPATGTLIGMPMSELDISMLEHRLRSQPYTARVNVHSTMDGVIKVELWQRKPILRFKSDGVDGYDFYLDSTLRVLPLVDGYSPEVPIISSETSLGFGKNFTGKIDEEKFKKDAQILKKLINFVQITSKDDFLRTLIVQAYLDQRGELELIPRLSNQLIKFGELEAIEDKLLKLKKFYQQSFGQQWWESANIINLKYRDQVVIQ